MLASVFFDTNVLVYAALGTGKDESKRKRALELIASEDFATSAQVLQEFFVTVVKKVSRPLSAARALEWIEQWRDSKPTRSFQSSSRRLSSTGPSSKRAKSAVSLRSAVRT